MIPKVLELIQSSTSICSIGLLKKSDLYLVVAEIGGADGV